MRLNILLLPLDNSYFQKNGYLRAAFKFGVQYNELVFLIPILMLINR